MGFDGWSIFGVLLSQVVQHGVFGYIAPSALGTGEQLFSFLATSFLVMISKVIFLENDIVVSFIIQYW